LDVLLPSSAIIDNEVFTIDEAIWFHRIKKSDIIRRITGTKMQVVETSAPAMSCLSQSGRSGGYSTLLALHLYDQPGVSAACNDYGPRPVSSCNEEKMQTSGNQAENGKRVAHPATSTLHPRVYALLIGLAVWFVLSIWSFAGAGVTDYLLFVVSTFIFIVVALLLTILSRVGRSNGKPMADHDRLLDLMGFRHLAGPTQRYAGGIADPLADCRGGVRHDSFWNCVPYSRTRWYLNGSG
jgi:hypothetical protein